jgi:hypothetical protein
MSYADEYSDDIQVDDDSNLVKKLRSKIDELSARTKELETENQRFHTEVRKQSLASILEKKGYAPKVATFIPADVDISDEGVDGWLAEYGDAFTPVTQSQQAELQAEATTVVANAAQADAFRRMSAVESTAQADMPMSDVLGRIDQATNMDELVAALRGA